VANYLFIDLETTSLGSNAAVIELAAIPYIDGEIKPHYHTMIRPHDGATLDPKAFEVTKINVNEIWDYPHAKDVLNEFITWIDSHETVFNLAGHHIKFDRDHLFRLFCRNAEYGSFVTRFTSLLDLIIMTFVPYESAVRFSKESGISLWTLNWRAFVDTLRSRLEFPIVRFETSLIRLKYLWSLKN